MKRDFNLSNSTIVIHLINERGERFQVNYRLYDHPVAQKWLEIMRTSLEHGDGILNGGTFFGRPLNKDSHLEEKLKNTLCVHNDFCGDHQLAECMISGSIIKKIDQESLSLLHTHFEKYAEDERFMDVSDNLQVMNLTIHALESSLIEAYSDHCHVELLSTSYVKAPLVDEDYKFFSPDTIWGELMMTYGITGVPTINAFFNKADPTPQNFMTNGMMMAFWEDSVFGYQEELNHFLSSKGLKVGDPKNALGYFPLGIMENLEQLDRRAFIEKLAAHKKVVRCEISERTPSALKKETGNCQWPFDQEIFYHLDLVPYIDMQVKFDSMALFEEAFRARDYFVTHREYDQSSNQFSGKWKSLGLHALHGDHQKTQYHNQYEFEGEAVYKNTVFAELCPETMKFLETITDVSKCERVRFMLLEPGASIKTHRDSTTRDVSLAVNISLNMPEGCEFFAQVNPDGTESPYSYKIPFKDSGSVILFNNAKYHRVVNNSDKPRIHIIFHGPTKFSDEKILSEARAQNKIYTRKELLKRLIAKKAFLREELTKTPILMNDWLASGLAWDSLPVNYAVGIYDHETYHANERFEHHLLKRTIPSLFPMGFSVIKETQKDEFLKLSLEQGRDFVILVAAGTFVQSVNQLIVQIMNECSRLVKQELVAAGHLMDFNDGKQLPYFHEQFLIVNLKKWKEIGCVELGALFSPEIDSIPQVHVSEKMIHDDYTPVLISAAGPGLTSTNRTGRLGWGSSLIKKAVQSGSGVMNLSQEIRETKLYAYPRDELQAPKEKIEHLVESKLKFSRNEVYYFNNEELSILKIPKLKINKLISVAAGFKPFHILKQFETEKDLKVHFTDFSPNALTYMKSISQSQDFADLESKVSRHMQQDKLRNNNHELASSLLQTTLRDSFDQSPEALMDSVYKTRNASFEEVNLIANPEQLTKLVEPSDRFVIWISNSFYNNHLYLLLTKDECERRLEQMASAIGKKTSLRVFRHPGSHTFLFGKGLDFIQGILTDGAAKEIGFEKSNWNEIITEA